MISCESYSNSEDEMLPNEYEGIVKPNNQIGINVI